MILYVLLFFFILLETKRFLLQKVNIKIKKKRTTLTTTKKLCIFKQQYKFINDSTLLSKRKNGIKN